MSLVLIEKHGHVAQVTLNTPPHNFVSVDSMKALADAFDTLDADPEVRAIILCSEGKSFCAGAELTPTDEATTDMPLAVNPLYDQAVRLFSNKKPIVVAVQGAAIGAGLGLALVGDFRIASPRARFSANFVKLGFHPGFGITHTLPRIVGEQAAADMCLTGRRVSGEEAFAIGLVDEVVEEEELLDVAHEMASSIAANAPLAVQATRATLRKSLADAVRAQTDHEFKEQDWLKGTEDFAEGIRAVAERRDGEFKGK